MTNKEAVTVSRTATARVAQFFAMYMAYLEVASGEIGGLKPDEPILSFMGCGASDRLLVKDIEGFLKEQQEPAELACPKCGHVVGCLGPLCDFKSKVTA